MKQNDKILVVVNSQIAGRRRGRGTRRGTRKMEEEVNKSASSPYSGDFNPCPICLRSISQESYLNQCFHKFCYSCIIQWTKVVAGKNSSKLSSLKCPLCKVENFSIIHGFDGNSFQQYYINQDLEIGFALSKEHKFRLQCYYTEPGLLSDLFIVSRYWKLCKYAQPNRWLQSWLRREIQALIQEEDVEIIVHHIHGVIDSFVTRSQQQSRSKTPEAKREEFQAAICDAARPFLTGRTDRFLDELEHFLASGLNIEAYDAVYKQRLGWSTPEVTSEIGGEGELREHRSLAPYLYVFDEDSDGTE